MILNNNSIYRIFSSLRFSVAIILLAPAFICSQGQDSTNVSRKISLLFIGDIMGHDSQIHAAENKTTHSYDYTDVFRFVKPLISESDIAIANLEVTLAGPPYKGYPQFSSPAELAEACSDAGINYLVTANNHAADRGSDGIISTINKLDSMGISHTGTFINQSCRDSLYPLMIKCKGVSIALLNYTFSTNGIKVPQPVIVNMLDKDQISRDIIKAQQEKAGLIILFLHWGNEYDTIPSTDQTGMADYFLSLGVDMVIGSHPHVLQKMIWVKDPLGEKDRIVVFSLGNFLSNQRKPKTDGGSMVRVEFVTDSNSLQITDAGYYLTWVYTPVGASGKKFYILPCSEFENRPDFFDDKSDYYMMMSFLSRSRQFLEQQNKDIPEILTSGSYKAP